MISSKVLLAATALLAIASVASAQCQSPFQNCDFYFNNYRSAVPTWTLSKQQVNHVLSSIIVHKSGNPVITANNDGNHSCEGPQCSPLFFFRNSKPGPLYVQQANRLAAHPVPLASISQYEKKCILLYMDNLNVQKIGWLNPKDNKKGFPEDRRCVVYYTKIGKK
eukprot:TRINITY_DN32067_c0_g1_i1.p1 TRINITY_DN32067_c0_g1~~TRINITY_DN32067_c0_g1_i1.p1  ORF type:complete len:165 (+),score=16.44 TRINITY_DN32067_c0_g1_i1:146-640(+)